MRLIIVGILVLTLGIAGLSTYLIKSFKTDEAIEELEKEMKEPKKFVLVAMRDIPIGEAIKPEDMDWMLWSNEVANENYVIRDEYSDERAAEEKRSHFVGTLVRRKILTGEPILTSKVFKRDAPGFLAGTLGPGMRAFTLKVNEETSAAGFIYPGDRVDILLTHTLATQVMDPKARKDDSQPLEGLGLMTETILRNMRVITIGQQVENFEQKATVVGTVTLEVSPKQAEMLSVAKSMGKLSLVLRSLAKDPEAEAGADALSFTTDVEVSPFLISYGRERQATALARREMEEQQRQEQLRQAMAVAEKRMQMEVEAKVRIEAEKQARLEAAEKKRVEDEEQERLAEEERKRLDAEVRVRLQMEEKERLEADEQARNETEEQKRLETEQRLRLEAEMRLDQEASEKALREEEEQARRAAEPRSGEVAATPVPTKKSEPKIIKVYRGQAQNTEEITSEQAEGEKTE
jgi:pilus assembly protein CpaB